MSEDELKKYGVKSVTVISELLKTGQNISPVLIIKYFNGKELRYNTESFIDQKEVDDIIIKEFNIKNRKKKLKTICGHITEEKQK
jgi:hypothetical protein